VCHEYNIYSAWDGDFNNNRNVHEEHCECEHATISIIVPNSCSNKIDIDENAIICTLVEEFNLLLQENKELKVRYTERLNLLRFYIF
jgi:hypothetical protein